MITRVEFLRFRGFARLRAELDPHAYIVGPNSAGKSTILEAIGICEQCLRVARRKTPSLTVRHNGNHVRGFPLRWSVDGEDDPVRHEFGRDETRVSIYRSTGGSVHIVWPEETGENEEGFFYLDNETGPQPRTLAAVRALFPPVTIVPVVTPLDRVEEIKNLVYVEAKSISRLASRHFRNHLWAMSRDGEWKAFKDFCELWIPEIELLDVSLDAAANRIAVFYSETGSRVPKELAWAGDGIQIWVQLLWHLYRARASGTIVLDEPEVYLHPDLQRRLVRLLDGLPSQIILASHSGDVIAEAPRGGVLWVDRRLNSARRPKSQQSLSDLSASLGTSFNLTLARSMRARLVVATDSEDLRIIRLIARHIGASIVANEHTVSLVHLREVEAWSGANQLGETLRDVLPPNVRAVVLLQGGFRPDFVNAKIVRQLTAPDVTVSFWAKAELENYLLDPETIARLSGAAPEAVERELDEACHRLRELTRAAFTSAWVGAAAEGMGQDALMQAETSFDTMWLDATWRRARVRGTLVIGALNLWLEADGYRAISGYTLAKAIRPNALIPEVFHILHEINDMVS